MTIQQFSPGDEVQTYSHPNETCRVLEAGRMLKLRAGDGREFWVGAALVKPIAQVTVQE